MTFDEWWNSERSALYQDRNSHEAARAAWDAALALRPEVAAPSDRWVKMENGYWGYRLTEDEYQAMRQASLTPQSRLPAEDK